MRAISEELRVEQQEEHDHEEDDAHRCHGQGELRTGEHQTPDGRRRRVAKQLRDFRVRKQQPPATAGEGDYALMVCLGDYPDEIVYSGEIAFTKLPGEGQAVDLLGWQCADWEKDDIFGENTGLAVASEPLPLDYEIGRWVDFILTKIEEEGKLPPVTCKEIKVDGKTEIDGVRIDEIDHEKETELGPALAVEAAWRSLELDDFLKEADFRRRIEEGAYAEWALVHGTDHYGTPREPVERALSEGRDIVLEIDYQGARSVRSALPEAVMVFVAPPDIATLLQRLSGRNTEDAETVRRRMSSAYIEFSNMGMFEYVLVNDDLATACDELEAVYTAERMRSRRCGWQRLRDRLLADMDERLR